MSYSSRTHVVLVSYSCLTHAVVAHTGVCHVVLMAYASHTHPVVMSYTQCSLLTLYSLIHIVLMPCSCRTHTVLTLSISASYAHFTFIQLHIIAIKLRHAWSFSNLPISVRIPNNTEDSMPPCSTLCVTFNLTDYI